MSISRSGLCLLKKSERTNVYLQREDLFDSVGKALLIKIFQREGNLSVKVSRRCSVLVMLGPVPGR